MKELSDSYCLISFEIVSTYIYYVVIKYLVYEMTTLSLDNWALFWRTVLIFVYRVVKSTFMSVCILREYNYNCCRVGHMIWHPLFCLLQCDLCPALLWLSRKPRTYLREESSSTRNAGKKIGNHYWARCWVCLNWVSRSNCWLHA